MVIKEWQQKRQHPLIEIQKLFRKLLHVSSVVPAGRAYLTSLERMLASYTRGENPLCPHTPPADTNDDLRWWKETLTTPDLSRPIPGPSPVVNPFAFSDASSGVGIGIIIGTHWRAWRLLPGWKAQGRDIGWAEAIRFELLVSTC